MEQNHDEFNKLLSYLSYKQHHNLPLHLFSALKYPGAGTSWGAWPKSEPVFSNDPEQEIIECIKALFLHEANKILIQEGKTISCDEEFAMVNRAAPIVLAILDQLLYFSSQRGKKRINWRSILTASKAYVSKDVFTRAENRLVNLVLYQHVSDN